MISEVFCAALLILCSHQRIQILLFAHNIKFSSEALTIYIQMLFKCSPKQIFEVDVEILF